MSLEPIILLLRGVLLFSLFLDATIAQAQNIEELKKGVVRITAQADGKNKVGTGFIVKFDSDIVYIMTAAHVISGDSQPKVQFFSRQEVSVRAQVKHAEGGDDETGMALLVVRGKDNVPPGLATLPLATVARVSGGEDIMVIGHPRGAGDWAIIKGSIAARQGRYLTVDANIDEGNSGGPIMHSGQVVGLIGGAQRYGKGVTIGTVREYLEGHGVVAEERASPSVAKAPPPSSQPTQSTSTPTREIAGKDGAPMVLIPAGEFMMGSPDGEGDKDEYPRHRVALSAFYLDKYEVTNRRFEQFVRETNYRTTAEQEGKAWALTATRKPEEVSGAYWQKPEGSETVFASNRDDHPVVSVSWIDAQTYCRWTSKRLPTEAEFEYATRGGTTTSYWWGNGTYGSRLVANIADESLKRQYSGWAIMTGYDDGSVRTARVGSFEANPFGLHDMTGNIAEWTADWYDPSYYGKSQERNPIGPTSGQYRVLRGGSWMDGPEVVRSAFRGWTTPTGRADRLGFRCAQDLPK